MDTARWQIFAQQFSQLWHRQHIASSSLPQNFQCLDGYAAGASAPQGAMAGLRRLYAQLVFGA